MSTKYVQGATITIKAEFRDSGAMLVDPSEVYLKYKLPDSSVVTKSYSLTEVTKISSGIYSCIVVLDQSGNWSFRWEGTGVNGSVSETTINVTASKVI